MKKICLDIETTGITFSNNEILQVSIIDENENILLDQLFKPDTLTSWKAAEAVNNISPEMVKDKPSIQSMRDIIINIINSADIIIGYNVNFDLNFLQEKLNFKIDYSKIKRYDVMIEFRRNFSLYEKINFKLTQVCQLMNIELNNAHNSLGDAIATLKVYKKMQEELRKPKLFEIYKVGDKLIYSKDLANEYSNKINKPVENKLYIVDNKMYKENELKDLSKYCLNHDYVKLSN